MDGAPTPQTLLVACALAALGLAVGWWLAARAARRRQRRWDEEVREARRGLEEDLEAERQRGERQTDRIGELEARLAAGERDREGLLTDLGEHRAEA